MKNAINYTTVMEVGNDIRTQKNTFNVYDNNTVIGMEIVHAWLSDSEKVCSNCKHWDDGYCGLDGKRTSPNGYCGCFSI